MRLRVVISSLVLLSVTLFALFLFAFQSQIEFYSLTGSFYPIEKIDRLQSSVGVTSWTENELVLADGRTARLPGIRKLPLRSEALSEATGRGIEIAPDGRIYGLVRIHHWCGNDPVREHIARVDVAEMLLFLGEGEPTSKLATEAQGLEKSGGTFSQFGWRVGEFSGFEMWYKIRQLDRESTLSPR